MKKWLYRLVIASFGLFILYNIWVFAHILYWRNNNPESTAFMVRGASIFQKTNPNQRIKQEWVDYNNISIHLKRALIASEDAKFNDHEGFDWDGIEIAFEKNLKKGRIVAGGSTISQQLAKNLFLSPSKNPLRKLEEAIITFMMEQTLSKRRILEIYLNVIEWGNGVYGAQAAAQYYFKTNAANLTSYQAAKLAAMVPNPKFYDINRNARGLSKKTRIIQRRLTQVDLPDN
ncbi:MAG: monofunctional biosynthetic peptidoglycan transglycosylase [Neisseriaceae bacterium]|nr:monofunctional biosynthetic peptidoglycan transglycosylase [Neisseriaceae bacterium]